MLSRSRSGCGTGCAKVQQRGSGSSSDGVTSTWLLLTFTYLLTNPHPAPGYRRPVTQKKVAVAKGLVSAAQHRKRHRPIVLTVHNVTTARDLQSPQANHPRRRTSHQQLARNNCLTLQRLNAQPGVTVTLRVDAGPPPAPLQHIAASRPPNQATCARCTRRTPRPTPEPSGTN